MHAPEPLSPIELRNAATGLVLRVLDAPRDSRCDPLVLDAVYPPHSPAPPDHFHPMQRERFEIREGELMVRIDGVTRAVRAGDAFEVPANARHAMWNASSRPAAVRWRIEPALGTLALFSKLCDLAANGRTNAAGVPGLLQSAVLAAAYRNELRTTRPAPAVQRVAVAVLAPLGRAMGLRAR